MNIKPLHIVLLVAAVAFLAVGTTLIFTYQAPERTQAPSQQYQSTTYPETPPTQPQPTLIVPKPSFGLDMDEIRRLEESRRQQQQLDELQSQQQELERLLEQQRQQELEIREAQERQEEIAAYLRLASEYDADANDAEEWAQHYWREAADVSRSCDGDYYSPERASCLARIADLERAAQGWHRMADEYREKANYYRQKAYNLSLP